MKTHLTKFLAISSIGLLMLASCKKQGALVVSNGGKAGTLTASTLTPNLDRTKVSDPATVITFSFTSPTYNFSAAVNNTLQIDVASDNWAHPTSVAISGSVTSQGYSIADFNSMLLKLNLPADAPAQVQARIVHSLSSNTTPIYSNVITITATPFNLTSWVYVPGAYEGSSWPNPGPLEDSLISATGNGIYTGIINFSAGNNQFLIVPAKNWNNKWATSQGPVTSGTTASYSVTYNGASNFYAPPAAGNYIVTLNTNTNQLTIVQADFYSILGSTTPGTAWQTDTPLKYINDGTGRWAISGVPMIVGIAPNNGFKVRQDDAWTNSWGTLSAADGKTLTDASGVNISIPVAGNYDFTFVMPATPLGTAPAVTTAYTLIKE